jgi:hypothetical protein
MQVVWGVISMVNAEKRLLVNALEDVDNQFFVLLLELCRRTVASPALDDVPTYGTDVSEYK